MQEHQCAVGQLFGRRTETVAIRQRCTPRQCEGDPRPEGHRDATCHSRSKSSRPPVAGGPSSREPVLSFATLRRHPDRRIRRPARTIRADALDHLEEHTQTLHGCGDDTISPPRAAVKPFATQWDKSTRARKAPPPGVATLGNGGALAVWEEPSSRLPTEVSRLHL